MTIQRTTYFNEIIQALQHNPVVALVGSRQSGKTTLARQVKTTSESQGIQVHYFDLEYPIDLQKLDNPVQALEKLEGLVIIDEIQRKADIFPILRVFADRTPLPAKFLVLGSASGELLKQTSESLAGRISYIELHGLGLNEVGENKIDELWIRGGYPRSFLADNEEVSFRWREDFIQTFLERDIPMLGNKRIPTMQLWRFWQMAAHYHGQLWNHSEIANSLAIPRNTVRDYLDLLTDTFMVRQIAPWYENIGKTLVKTPKFYIRDSGLLHSLLRIKNLDELQGHPKLGASWEGFVIEELICASHQNRSIFFWSTHSGGEIDLVLNIHGQRWGFEVKYADAPKKTRSMISARDTLNLDQLFVVYPGKSRYWLDEKIEVISLKEIRELLNTIK